MTVMNKTYEDCKTRIDGLKKSLKGSYPKMMGLFFDKNILLFLEMDHKMMNPSRPIYVSEEKYKILLEKLKKFNKKKFVLWLINKSN